MSNGSTTWTYTYDANGLRTGRSNDITNYSYIYSSGQLVYMNADGYLWYFSYDAAGVPIGFAGSYGTFFYVTNQQGDVVAILDEDGSAVVEYTYDAWGNILSVTGSKADTLGKYNPLRYRGYVYDHETGLYYLQSRYYDPEIGRFINADGFISTGQGMLNYNIFAYCNNDPVNYKDPNGATPIDLFASLFIGAINNFINAIYYEFSDGKSNLASDSYTDENKIVTRWEKLDYTKQETGEDHYNVNAWRYYNEYSVHEYGWYAVGWADEKNIWGFSWLAERFKTADVYPNCWDGRWYVDIATVFVGLLGI